jgi:hypothetical protein
MRKLLIVLAATLLVGGVAYAADTITVQWDPPTHRAGPGDDCNTQGTALTQAEIDSLEYTLSYRQIGEPGWTNVDTTTPSVQLTLPGYEVDYEFAVGARFPGGTILCATDPITYTTDPDTSPPGNCENLSITKNP